MHSYAKLILLRIISFLLKKIGALWLGDWVGLRIGLNVVSKRRKNPSPSRPSNPGRPARSLVTTLIEHRVTEENVWISERRGAS